MKDHVQHANRFRRVLTLSPREYEIFLLMGDGASPADIVKLLGVTMKTVETYAASLRQKLNLPTTYAIRSHAAKFIERLGKPTINRHAPTSEFVFNSGARIEYVKQPPQHQPTAV